MPETAYIANTTDLTAVANAIRTKGGTSGQLSFPNGFVSAIGNISGGSFSTAEVTLNITLPAGKTLGHEGYEYTLAFPNSSDSVGVWGEANNHICNVILYNGEATGFLVGPEDTDEYIHPDIVGTPTITGNITYSEGAFTITGDGTITATYE